MEATAFLTSPYHWPTIGWKEDIERFTLDDLKAHYKTYYNPVNAILVVVGDFKREQLLPKIEKAFGSMAKGNAPNQERDVDPKQTGGRRVFVMKEAQLPYLVMGYHVPNLREPDSYALEVTASLLSAGKSSRLYQSLVREKRLALSVDADHSLLSKDPSLFYLSAELLPGKEVKDVENALEQEVERLKKELVGTHELEKAKNQLAASFIFSQDSLFSQAMLLAQHEIALTWRAIDDYLPSIQKVSPEDIQRVVKKFLTSDIRTVGILIPLPP